MKKKRIREGKYGSGINIPDPQQYGHKTIKNTGSKSHHTVPDAGGAGWGGGRLSDHGGGGDGGQHGGGRGPQGPHPPHAGRPLPEEGEEGAGSQAVRDHATPLRVHQKDHDARSVM